MNVDLDNPEVYRQRLVHIDRMLAAHDRERQEYRHEPSWQIATTMITAMAAGAALVAAGMAFAKFMM